MFIINIDPHSTKPMYEQVYDYLKTEIKTGNLPFHFKLPSTRNLASNLQVSRNTIDMAYAQLVSEGYIESIPKSGYYVCLVSDLTHIPIVDTTPAKPVNQSEVPFKYNFSPFAIDINSFPYNIWRKLSKNCMNENNNNLFLLGDNQGDENLRFAIARYLHESRNVNCNIDQIIVGAGADYLLQLLSQIFQYMDEEPSNLAMENPTYKQAFRIFTGMHYKVKSIKLDQSGIHMNDLYASKANIAYVTPSHQYPLGIVMPIKRRLELLQWANEAAKRYIIEDDHDSEFRYKGKPIPSLQGIDTSDKVIYIGTFSRAIAPAIRIGYMVLPKELLKLYKKHLYHYSSTVSRVDQNIMTQFIQGGYFERHLNKMRKIYKNKHDLMIQSLKIFGDKIHIQGENAGLHLVIHFNTDLTEDEIIEIASEHGIKLYGLKKHYISLSNNEGQNPDDPLSNDRDPCQIVQPSLLLGYANVPDNMIEPGITALYQVLNKYL
jgi:GntR family transcriptional regulator/MocR family aminotransferase